MKVFHSLKICFGIGFKQYVPDEVDEIKILFFTILLSIIWYIMLPVIFVITFEKKSKKLFLQKFCEMLRFEPQICFDCREKLPFTLFWGNSTKMWYKVWVFILERKLVLIEIMYWFFFFFFFWFTTLKVRRTRVFVSWEIVVYLWWTSYVCGLRKIKCKII